MSSVSEKGNGGNYRVSGRKSIHNHGTNCPFWHSETMGRYGLSTERNGHVEHGSCSTSQEGIDEVDNVMSKLARSSSPVAARKDSYRRNSLNAPTKSYTDDSDEDINLLSRSSPAILTPYSFCSEEREGANRSNFSNISRNSSSSQSRLNSSGTHSSNNTPSQNRQNIRQLRKTNIVQESTKKGGLSLLITSIIITVLIGIVVAYYNVPQLANTKDIYDKYSFYNDVEGVGTKYKVNDKSILQVRAGISTIFERQDTGSFIFAYNSGRRDFNLVNFENFVNELASYAAKYLRNHTEIIRHVVVDTRNLQAQSEEELMNEYIEDVNKTGVMLVKDLDRVPSSVAMAFHYYCDEYNPLVKKSAIFFTLNMARCPNMASEKYSHKNIEKCLAEKWVKMPQDNIVPLLNRVVNVVIDVTSDF